MFYLILRSCWRSRRRTILTLINITVGMGALTLLGALYQALYVQTGPPDRAARVVTRNQVSLLLPLPESYGQVIGAMPGVEATMSLMYFGGNYKDPRDPNNFFMRYATEPAGLLDVRREMHLSAAETRAFKAERTACIVSRALAEKLHLKLGDRIPLQGTIFPVNPELVLRGIYDTAEPENILYFQREYLQQGLPASRRGTASVFTARLSGAGLVPSVSKAIDERFSNSAARTHTEPQNAFELGFLSFLGDLKSFLIAMMAAVAFSILLITANTVAMSVRGRIPELGLLRTLGFSPGEIRSIVVGEMVLLSVAGCALGCEVAAFLGGGLRSAGGAFVQAMGNLSINPAILVLSFSLAILIGVASSMIPAWTASRLSITESLRATD